MSAPGCPRCGAADVRPLDPKGRAVRCGGCGGTWIGGHASGDFLREQVGVDPSMVPSLAEQHGGGRLICPGCAQRLQQLPLRGVLVDACLGCGGLWLDAGELAAITGGRIAEPPTPTPSPAAAPPSGATVARPLADAEHSGGRVPTPAPPTFQNPFEDDVLEARLQTVAVPLALLVATGIVSSDSLRGLGRIFLSMWIHELGHATVSWFTGFFALPGPWRTVTFETRSVLVYLVVLAALVAWGAVATLKRRWASVGAAALLVLVQAIGTWLLRPDRAAMWIVFGGDAGAMVIGSLLVGTVFVPRGHRFHQGWLRWGFLWIGAVALMDPSRTWWDARQDFAAIPFGDIHGVGLSDASKLVDVYQWGADELIARYTALSALCLGALTFVWAANAYRKRAALCGEA